MRLKHHNAFASPVRELSATRCLLWGYGISYRDRNTILCSLRTMRVISAIRCFLWGFGISYEMQPPFYLRFPPCERYPPLEVFCGVMGFPMICKPILCSLRTWSVICASRWLLWPGLYDNDSIFVRWKHTNLNSHWRCKR